MIGLVAPTCCWSLTTDSDEATSMNDGTAVLLGLEDEFTVLLVERIDPGRVRTLIEVTATEDACPGCGVLTSRIKDRPTIAVKDLKVSGQVVNLWWRKRRTPAPHHPSEPSMHAVDLVNRDIVAVARATAERTGSP